VTDSDLGDAVADRAEVVEDSLRGRFGMPPWLAQAIDGAQLAIGAALVWVADGSLAGWGLTIVGVMLAADLTESLTIHTRTSSRSTITKRRPVSTKRQFVTLSNRANLWLGGCMKKKW